MNAKKKNIQKYTENECMYDVGDQWFLDWLDTYLKEDCPICLTSLSNGIVCSTCHNFHF